MMIKIKKIDHIVITATDINRTVQFYEKLGFTAKNAGNRYELYAGDFKINIHELGRELLPHALCVQTGSADFCFEIKDLEAFKIETEKTGILSETDFVERTGVRGKMRSVYIRDPDGNLLEFCEYS